MCTLYFKGPSRGKTLHLYLYKVELFFMVCERERKETVGENAPSEKTELVPGQAWISTRMFGFYNSPHSWSLPSSPSFQP